MTRRWFLVLAGASLALGVALRGLWKRPPSQPDLANPGEELTDLIRMLGPRGPTGDALPIDLTHSIAGSVREQGFRAQSLLPRLLHSKQQATKVISIDGWSEEEASSLLTLLAAIYGNEDTFLFMKGEPPAGQCAGTLPHPR